MSLPQNPLRRRAVAELPFGAVVEGRLSDGARVVMRVRARERIRRPEDVKRIGEAAVRGETGAALRQVWAWVYGHDMPIMGPALAVSYLETPSTEVATEFVDPALLSICFGAGWPVAEA